MRGGVPGLCVIVDGDDSVVEASPATLASLGPHILGARFAELLVPAAWTLSPAASVGATPERRLLTFATRSGLPQTFDCRLARHEDRVLVVGGVDSDEADRVRREMLLVNQELAVRTRELQKANAELARVGQLKDLMLAMAAHDLRSPLMVVASSIGFVREDLWDALGEEHRELVANIEEAAGYMTSIVKSFLDVALIHAGKLRIERAPESIEALARRAARLLSVAARRAEVAIRIEVPRALPVALLDGPKVEQAIVNLLSNALRHSPAGSEVVLELGLDERGLTASVQDHGDGVPPEIERDLFQAFTHGPHERSRGERGIGLGLAITRRVAEGHGGSISVVSRRGEGARFTLCLPVTSADAG